MIDATEKGYAVIRSFEGRALKAYRDIVGVWTIGYGNTNHDKAAVAYLCKPIGAGVTITEDQAEYLLRLSIRTNYMPAVAKAMPGAKPNETDAGASFHYNTGAIGRASWVRHWLARNMAGVRESLLSWNKAGGKVVAGLTRRRKRELAMIESGDYGPEGNTKPPVLNEAGRVVKVPANSPDHPLAGTPGMLRRGDKGEAVSDLHNMLQALGYDCDSDDVNDTCVFGIVTESAVIAFQKSHPQLVADGIVGPATRAALKREADAKRKLVIGATATGAPSGSVVTADQLTGAHLPLAVYVILGVIVIGTLAYIGWRYRDEIIGFTKRQ